MYVTHLLDYSSQSNAILCSNGAIPSHESQRISCALKQVLQVIKVQRHLCGDILKDDWMTFHEVIQTSEP